MKAVSLGLDGSEHLDFVMVPCSSIADSLQKLNLDFVPFLVQIMDSYDPELEKTVFPKMAESGLFITPTIHMIEMETRMLDDHSGDSLLKYIGDGIIETYTPMLEWKKDQKANGSTFEQEGLETYMKMILPLYESNIPLLTGSDCGADNAYVYPGESLHKELQLLVQAGLTPQQALTASVINGPRFFDLEKKYGSIEKGKKADLIIIEENPFEDIKNTELISSVMSRGTVFTSQKIMEMLHGIEK